MDDTKKRIKIQMIQNGVTIIEIASAIGVTPSAVHQVITGLRNTPRIRAAIAQAIGLPVSEIWPDDKTNQEEAA